ncbi:MAG: hypothetical protein IPH04_01660 [Saprospirales bacterium]|nr:hypothetical protein [Saprospirales bacterium]
MTIHHLPLLLALAAISLLATSCNKDKDLTTEIEGTYIGSYEDDSGTLTLHNVKVEVTRKSDSEISCEMTWIEGFPAATFDAEMEDKTHFSVPLYASDGGDNYTGSGLLENDTLKIDFIPDSDPSAIEHYEGKRQ